jgi:hypothetical protein
VTGHAVKGCSGFVPKEGTNFDYRFNVHFHADVVAQIEQLKRPGDSLADVVRRAVKQFVEREGR